MMINSKIKTLLMAYFAGMASSVSVASSLYYVKPFEVTSSLVFFILFAGGLTMSLFAYNEMKKSNAISLCK